MLIFRKSACGCGPLGLQLDLAKPGAESRADSRGNTVLVGRLPLLNMLIISWPIPVGRQESTDYCCRQSANLSSGYMGLLKGMS